MALNSSGPLSFGGATTGQSINLELGVSATATASINSASFRTLAGVPSGAISVSNFYGKSNTVGNYSLNFCTSATWYPADNSKGIDSSNNFWSITSAGGSFAAGNWILNKWNSSNTFQSSRNFVTSPSSPFTTSLSINVSGTQSVGFDNNIYFSGQQGGGQSGAGGFVNLNGASIVKWSPSGVGTWTAGKTIYTFTSYYCGNTMYAAYVSSKAVCVASDGIVYWYPRQFWLYITGYDCCGNPLYSSNTYMMIGSLGSSLNVSTTRKPSDVTGQAGQMSAFHGGTNAAGVNFSATAVQVPSSGGFVTYIGKRIAEAGNWAWAYTYRVTFGGTPQVIYNDAGNSDYVDSTGAFIAIDYYNQYRLMKVDTNGTFQWGAEYVFPGYTYGINMKSACIDSSDNVYLIGLAQSYYTNPYVILVLKINSSGVLQWSRILTSNTTPSVTGDEQNLLSPAIAARGSDLVITFMTRNPNSTSSSVLGTVTYPQSGSFTGSTNVNFPGSADYYTFQWATLTTTVRAGALVSATSQTTTLPAASSPLGGFSSVNINNPSSSTLTIATTSVNY